MLNGKHLIAGESVASDAKFDNAPIDGAADRFSVGTAAHAAIRWFTVGRIPRRLILVPLLSAQCPFVAFYVPFRTRIFPRPFFPPICFR